MNRQVLAILAVALSGLLVAGSASATDYTFIGTAGAYWTNPASWDVGTGYPSTSADCATVQSGLMVDMYQNGAGPGTFNLGNFYVRNGSSVLWHYVPFTINTTGAFWFPSQVYNDDYSATFTINCGGNFYYNAYRLTYATSGAPYTSSLIKMTGNNTAIRTTWTFGYGGAIEIAAQGVWDNNSGQPYEVGTRMLVDHNATIGVNPNVDSHWYGRSFTFVDGQANLPALKSRVDFHYGEVQADNNAPGALAIVGGLTYPRDVQVAAAGYWGAESKNSTYTWKIKNGDVTVGRDLYYYASNATGTFVLDLADNTTGVSRNLTVYNSLYAYTIQATDRRFLAKFRNANVRVGGDLKMGMQSNYWADYAAIDFGNSTLKLGGNFINYYPTAFVKANWNAGTSTVICDGNGTGKSQLLNTYGSEGIALNNVIIRNPGGAVTLASVGAYETAPAPNLNGGDLLLHGNFSVECGTFNGNGRVITFNGPSHKLTNLVNPATYQFDDNINLLAGAVLGLGSQITIKTGDNLNMGAGSKLYLCGFTLAADGKTYNGALTGTTWANDGGTIFALSNVPEPATLLLLGTGLMGALARLRRRRLA